MADPIDSGAGVAVDAGPHPRGAAELLAQPPAEDESPVRTRDWRFPSTAWSVVALRRQLRSFFGAAGLTDPDLEDLVLATCEAATIGIEHVRRRTEPFFDVHAEIDGRLVRVVVRDYGRWARPGGQLELGLPLMTGLVAVSLTSGPLGTSVILSSVVDGGRR